MANSTEWRLLGELARARREHLGLDQKELAGYGGPGVSTVGKIERAAQNSYPTRTRHQLENALGWARGTVDRVLTAHKQSWWDDVGLRDDFIHDLIHEDIPDLSQPTTGGRARDLTDDELLTELTYRMKRYADLTREESDPDDPPITRAEGSSATDKPSQGRGSHGVEGLPPGSGVVSSRPAHGQSRSRGRGGAGTQGSSRA